MLRRCGKGLLLTPVGKLDGSPPLCVKCEGRAWNQNVFTVRVQGARKLVCFVLSLRFSAVKGPVCYILKEAYLTMRQSLNTGLP